jgi:alpha-methylacyl-CoA racemase
MSPLGRHTTMNQTTTQGPLAGLRVIEFTSIGPGPHCVMLLSDMGAEILRIDRPGGNGWPNPMVDRGRHTIELDIRSEAGRLTAFEAVEQADVVVEGNRPGVMERLGLGPDVLRARNPRLIYARMTGWGQGGPLAKAAGHDINYIALTGALEAIRGSDDHRIPPLNLVGDFGGGSLYLALGIVAALYERERSGKGQVIDAAIVDGVASMMTMFAGLLPSGNISLEPDKNLLGGRAPFYRCYECADGKYISVGALEPQFYSELLSKVAAPDAFRERQNDLDTWGERVTGFAELFKAKGRDEWCEILEGSDVCFAPVLSYAESLTHTHLKARDTYVEKDGFTQAAPAPRFSRTPGQIAPSGDGAALLKRWRTSSHSNS